MSRFDLFQLQGGRFKRELIFHIGQDAGFYSEFNNMVLAIIYCIHQEIKFRLFSADANFSVRKGWEDYFLPFCPDTRCRIHTYVNYRYAEPYKSRRIILVRIYKGIFRHSFLTFELWDKIRDLAFDLDESHLTDNQLPENRAINGKVRYIQTVAPEIISGIYRFNALAGEEVKKRKESISFTGEYIGFHMRAGDKIREHQLPELSSYIEKANRISDIRAGFIYTDDYRLFRKVCEKYPDWYFQTLTGQEQKGYVHEDFLALGPEQKRKRMIEMFASVELLSEARYIVCTYSSNIGMFLGMRHPEKVHGVDFDTFRVW